MNTNLRYLFSITLMFSWLFCSFSQTAMTNLQGRTLTSLNGKWKVMVDPAGTGDWRQVWKEEKPRKKTDFFEYSFEGGPVFNVPGDFNTQMPELTFFEGTVWYKKTFTCRINDRRLFLHFGAVNYLADVYLNGVKLGSHEGGFSPFQFEITGKVREGENTVIVKVNNQRKKDGVPSMGFDWFNYGGITRDVNLIETAPTFIEDYFIQLKKYSDKEVAGWIKLNGPEKQQKIQVLIPEIKVNYSTFSNEEGIAPVTFQSHFQLWNPENPKLYKVIIQTATDTITEEIGFRNIEVKGNQIFLNEKPLFLKGVNIHEENPLRAAKAFSETDALTLLHWAKELGCNMVRLAHYPHNEYMVRMAEKMGIMVWSEIPVYQHIEFSNPEVEEKISVMLREMTGRDKNRCSVIIWCLSNETFSFTPNRDLSLISLSQQCRMIDSTRLITSVINDQGYENNTFHVWDTLYRYFDVVSINEYIGWYVPWQGNPGDAKWTMVCPDKPVIISEFGGEALFGSNYGPKDEAAYWTEEYQEQIYKDQIELFATIPNLSGVCPWLLVDYRSPGRMHPVYQSGWNRKGLLSDRGEKKKAWFVMKKYYKSIP